jgi:hypothetical protein
MVPGVPVPIETALIIVPKVDDVVMSVDCTYIFKIDP